MFKSLHDFYTSREWCKFRLQVINDRMTPNGDVLDEVTKEPITKKYNIILHHIEPLTEENVFDFNISLNPDNIMIVSIATHNRLHNKLRNNGYVQKEVYLVYGPPCAGKSTFINEVKEQGDLLVDIDRIRQCISGCDTHIITPRLNSIVFGIRDYLMDAVKVRQGKWNKAYIIGGFPLSSERERICKTTGAKPIYIECDKEECIRRLKNNPDNRNINDWIEYINAWFDRYTPPLDD